MATYTPATAGSDARRAVLSTSGRSKEHTPQSVLFMILLWLSLLIGFVTLATLLVDTFTDGLARLDGRLFTGYPSSRAEEAGARPAILGSLWVVGTTAVLAVPLGVAAAVHLEEFADRKRWWNRLIEINISNLSAVPAIIYGMLALGTLALVGVQQKNIVIGGAIALAMLILPVIIISTREAVRAVPRELRDGSLAIGATPLQTTWRITLPAALPGIATGTILGLSRALGEAAPLLLLGGLVFLRFDPNGMLSQFTTMPIQIFSWTAQPQAEFHTLAAGASMLLMGLVLLMNGAAIYIRNRYQKRW